MIELEGPETIPLGPCCASRGRDPGVPKQRSNPNYQLTIERHVSSFSRCPPPSVIFGYSYRVDTGNTIERTRTKKGTLSNSTNTARD